MPTHEIISDSVIDRIGHFIDRYLVIDGIPGLSVVLVSPDDILYSNGFGAADLSQSRYSKRKDDKISRVYLQFIVNNSNDVDK